jgi:SsrA-binding protein
MAAKGKSKDNERDEARRFLAQNRKARFKYEVLDSVEAGLVLLGTEVKALRTNGSISIEEAFARADGGEIWLVGAHISEYSHGNVQNHEPTRKRKLLLHRREVRRLQGRTAEKGLTLVPLEVYFGARGFVKLKLGVCKGRKVHDKREQIRSKDDRRAGREA